MFGFITRLFGGNNDTIKDPQLGKVRFIESENGTVWAGHFLGDESHKTIAFFIESVEKVLQHGPRNKLLDLIDNYHNVLSKAEQRIIEYAPALASEELVIQFVHIPFENNRYDMELICGAGEESVSVLLRDLAVVDLI